MRFLGVLAILILAGCSAPNTQGAIAALEVGLTTAERGALIYATAPRCGGNVGPSFCSDPATVEVIKQADQTAYEALKAAQRDESLGPAKAALEALEALLNNPAVYAVIFNTKGH